MTAGLNIKVDIWKFHNIDDDEIGGAQLKDTRIYENLPVRIEANRPNSLLLDQGLETDESFQMLSRPLLAEIKERDEVEVVWPPEHRFYGKRFRITAIQATSMNPRDTRSFFSCILRRIDYAHAS